MKKASVRKQQSRHILLILAGFLALSALLRLSGETGSLLAKEVQEFTTRSDSTAILTDDACSDADHIRMLLSDLQMREGKVKEKEAWIADRTQALNVAETNIRANLDQLVAAEEELAATMRLARTAAESDVARLTSVYENMKPKEAAALFETTAPEFSAGFLARMLSLIHI